MISSEDIQIEYNALYAQIRNYIWDVNTVEALADLEIACYNACVDLDEVRSCLAKLKQRIFHVASEDEELQKAIDDFDELLEDAEDTYKSLYKVKEEILEDENF